MRNALKIVILGMLTAALVAAQPAVGTGGVLNAASYAFQGLPNSAIAQGSIFVVFGTGLGPTPPSGKAATYATFPLPTVLPANGTSISVTVNGTTVQAYMIYTTPTQIAAVLPSNTPAGTGTLTVTYNGQTSAPAPITVAATAFGIFAINQKGSGPAVVQNFVSPTKLPVNSLTTPANPGQTLQLYGTGLGAVTFNETEPAQAGNVGAADFEVTVGGQAAHVTYHGRSPCCSGLDQIDFVVPAGVAGCYVPISVRNGGVVSNFGSISVAASGQQACSDSFGFSASDLAKIAAGGTLKYGVIEIGQSTTQVQAATGVTAGVRGWGGPQAAHAPAAATTTTDSASAEFFEWDKRILQSQGLGIPSVGSCFVSIANGDTIPTDPIKPTALNAGPFVEIKGGPTGQTVQMTPFAQVPGFYTVQGGSLPTGFVGAGTYTADNGSGGPDVSAFNVSATFGAPLVWTNQSSISTVTRSNGVTVTWSGGASGDFVEIIGSSLAIGSTGSLLAYASFTCLANQSAQQFTVPASVLLSLPATSTSLIAFPGTLGVFDFGFQKVDIPGLDEAFFVDSSASSASVVYQ
jgi:uncharacterized protein (TIGR03437 family)